MPNVSLKAKRAYFAKVRQANYAASLRLEGVDVASSYRPTSSKAAVLKKYRQN
ncbi:YhfG family protein [Chromohalobacter nigrandesensis]|uniref:YhfG family protein n=1 Tax=Chromohalobacter nigrandesensis TaxID=119863 RepID=UPI003CCFF52E